MSHFSLVFDGGSLGNPGRGYGSYALREGDGPWSPAVRVEFGDHVTNNEAEYRALLAGLDAVAAACGAPESTTVDVIGDSKLVISHIQGLWKVKAANLRPLCEAARRSASRFRGVRYSWHPRAESVARLGH